MYWLMRKEFKDAYSKAIEVLEKIGVQCEKKIPTSSIIHAVEDITGVDVKFKEFDFSELDSLSNTPKGFTFSRYGAAMCVSENENGRIAKILLNSLETPEMQRFSLVHELGHLILENMKKIDDGFLFSTHIDMDITSLSEESIDHSEFLLGEQMANIFALIVLIPYNHLLDAMKEHDSLDVVANVFGVEKKAIISRIGLGINMGV